jgi:hypothetical protein
LIEGADQVKIMKNPFLLLKIQYNIDAEIQVTHANGATGKQGVDSSKELNA